MPFFTDQAGRNVFLNKVPQRIISLVPSQTELLSGLGLDEEVVGITKFCVHPASWFQSKKRVGGTKQLNFEVIHQLRPDLIIANKEENVKEQIEELENHYPVWVSDVNNLEEAYEMIEQIGIIINKEQPAQEIVNQIKENFTRLTIKDSRLTTAYLIWQNPYMAAGGDTFIHSMIMAAGFQNMCADKKRYPEITLAELQHNQCQLLLLSSEPFPFSEKHVEEIRSQGFKGQILLVDGEMFSWYGSRLLKAPAYFKQLYKQLNLSDLRIY